MDAFQAARAAVPSGQWLEVRYEDVLGDPRGQVTAMLEFLGLPWTPKFEAGFSRDILETGRRRPTAATSNPTSSPCSSGASPVTCRPTGTQRSSGPTQHAEDPDAPRRSIQS